eukprot:406721-Rhodomonas_salina.1
MRGTALPARVLASVLRAVRYRSSEKTAEADMDGMSDNLVPAKDAGRGEMWARNSKGGLESRTAREESSSNKAKLEQLALKYDK